MQLYCWRDPKKTLEAAEAMKLTSKELFDLNIIDEIVEEPIGGAHRDKEKILENVRKSITKHLEYFENLSGDEIILQRKNKFLQIGRNSGFVSKSDINTGLSLKKNSLNDLFENVSKYKKVLIISGISIITLLGLIYFL